MKAKNMTLEFSSTLLDIVDKNPAFDAARLRIAYTGKNRNKTYISKEAFEKAIPTMFNCPVVANYKREEHKIGSHDGEFIKDKDGKTQYVNITQPVGCIPESATWDWEIVEDNGVMHQYLCTDVLLWKRQEAYQFIKNNGITKQSMEISVIDGESEDEYFNIKQFCFTAFCLLGDAEPCFESAALFTFSTDEFKKQYTEMMHELKATFSITELQKEGNEDLNKLKELLEKYQVTEEELEFDYNDLSDDELESKFAEVYKKDKDDPEKDNDIDDVTDDKDDVADKKGFALNSQIKNGLHEKLSIEKITTDWGEYPRYCMVDFDLEVKEVYFYDENDGKLYGCTFNIDGDDVIIDFESKKRVKFAIVDYIEGAEDQPLEVYELLRECSKKYRNLSQTNKNYEAELEELRNFKEDTLKENRKVDEAELFKKFENQLKENIEFEALKKNADDYSLEDLEKELFILVGKMNFSVSDNKPEKDKPVIINRTHDSDIDDFGGLFAWKKEKK